MSVAEALGVTADQINDLIETHWPQWTAEAPDLELVPPRERLVDWLRKASPSEADLVLRALARLANDHAGGSRDAGLVLAWVMMPAATMLAHRLRFMSEEIDDHVAAHLWIAVRTFPWSTTGRVAANLKHNLAPHQSHERPLHRSELHESPCQDGVRSRVAVGSSPPLCSHPDGLAS